MRYAVLGGSFNPVHLGHLFLADLALTALGYDRVILVPAFQSPFKPAAEAPPPDDRLAMLAASIPGDSRLALDTCEILRGGVSYTIDTLADVRERYRPEDRLGLLLGSDLAADFGKWRGAADIASQADIIIARRSGAAQADFPFPFTALGNEPLDISSRSVREKIRNGGNWRGLVPQGARAVIEERGLYGLPPSPGPAPSLILRVEDEARALLKPRRFLHSRNTALLAASLCARFGLPPASGYLAGIAHDICKEMDTAAQLALAERDSDAVTPRERETPALLHGRAAAVFLRERWRIEDEAILDAARRHTICGGDMGSLAKIVYIADKVEVSREGVPPALRELRETAGLDALFAAVRENTVAGLKSQGKGQGGFSPPTRVPGT
ncbi:MAG: nicotinate (nicotinamide) nucleotide adenylyltransferase [Treponematales bacterium]